MSGSRTAEQIDMEEDDVFEIKREFEELKQKKNSELNTQHQDDIEPEDKNSTNIITGIVTEINDIDHETVEIVVEYIDEVKDEESFELKKPKNEKEFDIDNKFVRIVNFFGDRKNDPTSLKFRDIWMKKKNGDIVLDIPSNMSFTTKYKKKLSRISKYYGLSKINTSIYKTLIPSCLLLTIILTVGTMLESYTLSSFGYLAVIGFVFSVIGSGITAAIGAILQHLNKEDSKIIIHTFDMLALGLFIVSIMYIIGDIEITYAFDNGNVTGGSSLYSPSIASSIVYLPLYLIIKHGEKFIGSLKSIKRICGIVKRKYRTIKGIEYVRM